MNVGEKICSYKERLNHKNFQDFGRAADVSGDWINELSKKSEIKVTDMNNIIKLCGYLGISIDQLVKDDEIEIIESKGLEIIDINNANDIGILIDNMIALLGREGIKMNNVNMNDKSKEVCKDALNVVKTLIKQHL